MTHFKAKMHRRLSVRPCVRLLDGVWHFVLWWGCAPLTGWWAAFWVLTLNLERVLSRYCNVILNLLVFVLLFKEIF